MIDKRSPCPHEPRSQKRAKTFPLTGDDDGISTELDRRSTASLVETEATAFQGPLVEDFEETNNAESPQSPETVRSHVTEENGSPVAKSDSSTLHGQPKVQLPGLASEKDAGHDDADSLSESSPRDRDQSHGSQAPEDGAEESSSYVYEFDESEQDSRSQYELPEDRPERLGPWSPPPEPLRPKSPYAKGQTLMIRRHTACPPFGQDYPDYPGLREEVYETELRTKTLVELCLEHPPMEGETAQEAPRSLQITDVIRAKDNGGAQLLICRLEDEPDQLVAKVYDPLYYGFSNRMWSDQPRDVTDEADKDYCREVAAYLELDDRFGGKETPKYHGSWTFQVPLDLPDGPRIRDVRMILMELIPGRTMLHVKPDPYSEEVRLDAVARIIEAFNRIKFAGVRHGDISQRNIMLCDGRTANTIDRVVIIDFNFATVSRLDDFEERYGCRPSSRLNKPENPVETWWDGGLYGGFGEWLPESWERRLRPLQEWLYKRWGKCQDFAPPEEPLRWDEENEPQVWIEF